MTKAEREALLMEKLAEKKSFDDAFRSGGADGCSDAQGGSGAKYIAGVDEVGRGPLAGPVVAACVVLPEDFDVPGVDDSKKISEKKREALYDEIMSRALAVGIGRADNLVIDEINILQATKQAMTEAVAAADQMLRQRMNASIGHILFDAMTITPIYIKIRSRDVHRYQTVVCILFFCKHALQQYPAGIIPRGTRRFSVYYPSMEM